MARNVEIKARIARVESLLPLTAALANADRGQAGRHVLPLRNGSPQAARVLNGTGELIF